MKPRIYEKGQLIIKYGDVGHEYFVLAQGSVQVLVYQRDADPADPDLESKLLFTKALPKGAGFGEIALMYNDKRTASIKAEDQCKTYVLDGGTFKAIIIKSSIDKRIVQSGFLDKISLFNSLEKSQKLKLLDGLQTHYIKNNDYVFKQGAEGQDFFIIEQGEVACVKSFDDGTEKVVRVLPAGSHFGELALINNEKRSLSIRVCADAGAKLLSLDRETFTRILGSIEKHLKKDYSQRMSTNKLPVVSIKETKPQQQKKNVEVPLIDDNDLLSDDELEKDATDDRKKMIKMKVFGK